MWAKRRGIYSNKLGYLGGVNFNILVAMIGQLYTRASPSRLLRQFFSLYAQWEWGKIPVLLEKGPNGRYPSWCVCFGKAGRGIAKLGKLVKLADSSVSVRYPHTKAS